MSNRARAGIEISGDAAGFNAAAGQAGRAAQALEGRVDRLGIAIKRVGHYGAGLAGLAGAFAFGRQVVNLADQMTTLNARLRLVTDSSAQQASVQAQLFNISQQSRASFTELGSTYAQMARATKELGIPSDRLLGVTRAISQAMTIGGGSAEGMRAALLQLSQGLASGTLRGEELNSVMEQSPRLAQAIADGMGKTVGELRKLGEQGKITAEAVILALEKQAARLDAEFKRIPPTVSGATTVVANALAQLVSKLDGATGASSGLAGAMVSVADKIGGLAQEIGRHPDKWAALASAVGGAAAAGALALALGGIGTAVARVGALLVANPMVAALLLGGAAVGFVINRQDSYLQSEEGLKGRIERLRKIVEERSEAIDRTANDSDKERLAGLRRSAQAALARAEAELAGLQSSRRDELRKIEAASANELGLTSAPNKPRRTAEEEAAAKKATQTYANLNEQIIKRLTLTGAELAAGDDLTEAQKFALETTLAIDKAERDIGKTRADELRAKTRLTAARLEDLRLRDEERAAAEAAREAARAEGLAALERSAAMERENERLAEEVSRIGLSADALFAKEQAHIAATLAVKEHQFAELSAGVTYTLNAEALRQEIEALKERQRLLGVRRDREADEEWRARAKRQREEEEQESKRRTEALAKSIEDGILEGARSGRSIMDIFKNELKAQFARTVLRPIIMPQVEALNRVLEDLMRAFGGIFGGIFGGGLGPESGQIGGQGLGLPGGVFHGGGVVGRDVPAGVMSLPASAWARAPRYHRGMLAANEYPAILERGESVLTPAQMSQLAPAGAARVQVTLINQSGTPLQAQAQTRSDGGVEIMLTAIKDAIAGDISGGSGPIPRALQGRYGLRPSFASA
jgi:tape measure domain-containing protein